MRKQNDISIENIIKNGGATLNANGEAVTFSRGYQVSRRDCFQLDASQKSKIEKAINKLLAEVKHGEFVGIWIDSGVAYVDISENIKSRKKALAVGKSRKQISVYDWQNDTCIYC